MKITKWFGICLLTLLVSAGLVSCGEDEYHSELRELILKDISFDANDMEMDLFYTLTFRNQSLKNYAATPDASWCHVEINVEASQITVSVDENTSNEDRKSIVTIFDIKDPSVSRTFTVSQKQNNVVMVSGNTSYEVPTEGGSVTFVLQYNVSDFVVSKVYDEDWFHVTVGRTRALQAAQILVDVDKNDTGEARSGYITIESESADANIVCRIDQQFVGYFNILNTEFRIDERGGTVNINAQSNLKEFDVYMTPQDTWARNMGREFLPDLNVVTQKIAIDPYTEKGKGRSTSITVHNEQVTIVQYRNIYIEETEISLAGFESKALTLYNANGDAVKWTSSDESVATVDDKGVVTGHKIGTATIKVSSTDGKHTDTATVTVGGAFSIPVTEYNIDDLGGTVSIEAKTNLSQFEVNVDDRWATDPKIVADPEKGIATVTLTIAPYAEKSPGRLAIVKVNGIDVKIYQVRNLYIEETNVSVEGTESRALTLYNPNHDAVVWSSSDTSIATVDTNGRVTGIKQGQAVITVTTSDGKHSDTATVTVEKPKALTKDQLPYDWQINYETIGDTATVISAISCTLTNKSKYTIELSKCEFYRDGKPMSAINYNELSGKLMSGESKKASFDNLVMFKDVTITIQVPDPEPDPEPEQQTGNEDDQSDENAGGDTGQGADSRSHTRATETKVVRVLDTDPHSYKVVWYYTYNGENFVYNCDEIRSQARVKSRGRSSSANRSRRSR